MLTTLWCRGSLALAAVYLLAISGCGAMYPKGPVTQEFVNPPINYCLSSPSLSDVSPHERGTQGKTDICKVGEGIPNYDTDYAKCTDDKCKRNRCKPICDDSETEVSRALGCTRKTEVLYGIFLECREKGQIAGGVGLVALAAGAAGVAAAGVSAAAAASLGATAGAGLGMDYLLYSKEKTKAYANGVARLQCISSESIGMKDAKTKLDGLDKDRKLDLSGLDKATCTVTDSDPKKSDSGQQRGFRLADAEYSLSRRREKYVQNRTDQLPPEIVSTVKTIDARAFAASQAGVPDGDQIEKAIQSVGVALPSAKSAKAPGGGQAMTSASIEQAPKSSPACDKVIEDLSRATSAIKDKLKGISVPKEGFSDCLAIEAFEQQAPGKTNANTSSKSKTPKSQTGTNGNTGSSPSDSPSSGNAKSPSNDTPAQIPDKIAFQILPSDTISVPMEKNSASAGSDPTSPPGGSGSNSVSPSPAIPNIKIIGGTPPYYWSVLDPKDVSVIQASQNDLFVSLEAQPLNKSGGRILIGDQAGATEIVTVSQGTAPNKTSAGGAGSSLVNNICCASGKTCGSSSPGSGK